MSKTRVSRQRKRRPSAAARPTEVVFGGGANRGFFHIGLIKALVRLNVWVGMITGVSIGSVIATFFANGYSPEDIEEIFIKELARMPAPNLVRSLLLPPWVGKLTGRKTGGGLVDLPAFFAHLIQTYRLKPQTNLRIIAYNVFSRRPVVFEGTDYDLLTALCASCAVPLLMWPVWFGQPDLVSKFRSLVKSLVGLSNEGLLVDGGVHHPYPGTFSEGPAIIGKLGFASELPKRWLSPTDLYFHLMEMLLGPLLNWYFRDPEGHLVIELGTPDVACMTFGLPREQCIEMVDHGERVSLSAIGNAINSGTVTTNPQPLLRRRK